MIAILLGRLGGLRVRSIDLRYCIDLIVDYNAIAVGQDWAAIRQTIVNWINSNLEHLEFGYHENLNIPGVPFPVCMRKKRCNKPGLYFARFQPDDSTLSVRLNELIERKASKLRKYRNDYQTIVLLESEDIALMNEGIMLEALIGAFPSGLPSTVFQLWYADTSIPEHIEFLDFTEILKDSRGT